VRFSSLWLASGKHRSVTAPVIGRVARSVVALAMVLGVGSGCPDDQHVGRPCDPGTSLINGGSTILLSDGVAECPSAVCVAADNARGTGALCSARCESNADCEDGEIANPNDPSDTRCKTGFACMWPTTVGRLHCQRLCVCRDLVVSEPPGGFQEPVVCQ
jgi:hypothetical protein